MTTPAERDTHLLSIGKQCSHSSCLLVDFLPFKCQHCDASFCQEHFMVSAHQCPNYDESKYNRVAPNCPFCHVPVAFRQGQDPNARMEEHFVNECSVMSGRAGKATSAPKCARASCKKVLFTSIRCTVCKEQFCPAHRFPADHKCTTTTAQPPKPASSPHAVNASKRIENIAARSKDLNSKASAASSAAVGAIKKSIASGSDSIAEKASASNITNPFSKADRRARAEQESKRRALEARAKKGLLTEDEQKALVSGKAKAKPEKKKDDCIVM